MEVHLRPFAEEDYDALVAIANLCFPDRPTTVEMARHRDSLRDVNRHFRLRLVAEDAGQVVAWGDVQHSPWQFHPDKYRLSLCVTPAWQRRGVGSTLYARLLSELRGRDARLVRAEAQESRPDSVDFLDHRGFRDVQRAWESRLDVVSFDFARFEGARPRVDGQGIRLTSLAAEGPADEGVRRAIYQLDRLCTKDEPALDPVTLRSFDLFVRDDLDAPNAIPEAYFLAKDGDAYVGLSALYRRPAQPEVFGQGFTCVHPAYRGRGIAMALKLQTVRYAREHGVREIRTGNNSRNRPMLRINEAMGFVKQPAWIEFQKDLLDAPTTPDAPDIPGAERASGAPQDGSEGFGRAIGDQPAAQQ